jgi:poly(A) polymerase
MLRVARFTGKLGFKVEPKTRKPIRELAELVHNVPAARLFDEMLKLLLSGKAMACLHELRREGLHHGLLPMLDLILEQPDDERFVTAALAATDARVHAGKSTSPGFLFAALLWQPVRQRWQAGIAAGEHSIVALAAAIDSVLDEQAERIAIQRRFIADMREIWMTQPRFERRTGRSPYALVAHLRFRAAYDFLLLRCESGELPAELGEWWDAFATADESEREALLARAASAGGAADASAKKRRRRSGSRRGRGRAGAKDTDAPVEPSHTEASAATQSAAAATDTQPMGTESGPEPAAEPQPASQTQAPGAPPAPPHTT